MWVESRIVRPSALSCAVYQGLVAPEEKDRVVDGRVGLCRRQQVLNNVFVQCPLRAGGDLSALGVPGTVDLTSVRVVEDSAGSADEARAELLNH